MNPYEFDDQLKQDAKHLDLEDLFTADDGFDFIESLNKKDILSDLDLDETAAKKILGSSTLFSAAMEQSSDQGVNLFDFDKLFHEEDFFIESSYPVHRLLARYVRQVGVTFKIGDHTLDPEQVFQPEALLPIVALDAERIWGDLCSRPARPSLKDDSLMTEFESAREGFFPLSAHPVDIKNDLSSTLRMLSYILAARRVFSLKENQTIELTPYLSAWRSIDWTQNTLPQIPTPESFDREFFKNEFKTKEVEKPKRRASPFASQNKKSSIESKSA